ncbi:MAG: hypothetical protein ACR2HN_09095 [Tepidiformaceae bacterium]
MSERLTALKVVRAADAVRALTECDYYARHCRAYQRGEVERLLNILSDIHGSLTLAGAAKEYVATPNHTAGTARAGGQR